MYESPNGEYVRGLLLSDDITTPVDVPLFDRNGNARTLKAGERLVLNFISLNNGATASVITLFQDNDGGGTLTSGEELYRASIGIAAQNFLDAGELHLKPLTATGGKLRVIASVASVKTTIVVIGFILNS